LRPLEAVLEERGDANLNAANEWMAILSLK